MTNCIHGKFIDKSSFYIEFDTPINSWADEFIVKTRRPLKDVVSMSFNGRSINKEFINQFINLVDIDIEYNNTLSVNIISDLSKLVKIKFHSKIIDIDQFPNINNLSELDVSNCNLKNTDFLKSLTTLKTLIISGNYGINISYLPSSLQELYCGSCNLVEFPVHALSNTPYIEKISCSSSRFKTIGDISALTNLKGLILTSSEISEIGKLPENLISLDLIHCREIKSVNSLNCPNLKTLLITDSKLNVVNLSKLPNLKMLFMNNCGITEIVNIPPSIKHLTLKSNKLKTFPKEFLSELITLNISMNPINNLDFIHYMPNLTNLYIDACPIITIPDSITTLNNLKFLGKISNAIASKLVTEYIKVNSIKIDGTINSRTFYSDAQNTHDTFLIRKIKNILEKFESKYGILYTKDSLIIEINENKHLSAKSKTILIGHINGDIMLPEYKSTFDQLLINIWSAIKFNPLRENIFELMDKEIIAKSTYCYTGQFHSIINCLGGFDDLVLLTGDVVDILSNICLEVSRLPVSLEDKIKLAKIDMKQYGFNDIVIETWVQYITE